MGGMNTDITPENLPPQFSPYIENFIPNSFGSGEIRRGTSSFRELPGVKGFPLRHILFSYQGEQQLLVYFNEFVSDSAVLNWDFTEQQITISGSDVQYYKDTKIRFRFTDSDENSFSYEDVIKNVSVNGTDQILTLTNQYSPSDHCEIFEIDYSVGNLYLLSEGLPPQLLWENLRVDCIPRFTAFQYWLLLTNGLDDVLVWDGQGISEVTEWAKHRVVNLAKTDTKKITFTQNVPHTYKKDDKIKIDTEIYTLSADEQVIAPNQKELTTIEDVTDLMNFPELFWLSKPPKSSFFFVDEQRLFALGQGAAGLDTKSKEEKLVFYVSRIVNDYTRWIDEETGDYYKIDLRAYISEDDNLEAIASLGDYLLFIGKNHTFLFSGSFSQEGSFYPASILPEGVFHGDLLVSLPNDLIFVSASGLKSASTLNVAKQYAVSSLTAINSEIKKAVSQIMNDNFNYRLSWCYNIPSAGEFGVKLGQSNTYIGLYSSQVYYFNIFTGDFLRSTSVCTSEDGDVILGIEGNSVIYSPKANVYTDKVSGVIPAQWETPYIGDGVSTIQVLRMSLDCDYNSFVAENSTAGIEVRIDTDYPRRFGFQKKLRLLNRGDLQGNLAFEFRASPSFETLYQRLKFIARRFKATVIATSPASHLYIRSLKILRGN